MADLNLTQSEADALLAMEKKRVDDKDWVFPPPGVNFSIRLTSLNKRENFMLDANRSQIKLLKATFQNRARVAIVLVRLEIDGPPHTNPDGQAIPCPHLHVYREGYGDKWAHPAPANRYPDPRNLLETFEAFMRHCNITDPPRVEMGLYS